MRLSADFLPEEAIATAVELPDDYGTVQIPEDVVQRIWARGDFHTQRLCTQNGQRLRILHPGRWNRLGGPDFREAVLEMDGIRRVGDVEIHFYASDWDAHGHAFDRAFDDVILHVVVFPGGEPAHTSQGRELPVLELLPRLNRDLEAHAAEDALLAGTDHTDRELLDFTLCLAPQARREELCALAHARWRQKRQHARQRLSLQNWEQACHQAALEVLGYRRNRAPMAALAQRFPLGAIARETPESLLTDQAGHWRMDGLRPANHPQCRLAQYLRWVRGRPDWPHQLLAWGQALGVPPYPEDPTGPIRREAGFAQLRSSLVEAVLGEALSGPRVDTLLADAFFPLLSVHTGRDLFGWWYHWKPGDAPARLTRFLREAAVCTPENPPSNGLIQGALHRTFARDG